MSKQELESLAASYSGVLLDIGTGDGKFVYRTAQANPNLLCLGVDADLSSLFEYSRKSERKPERGGVPNALFILASVERLPVELDGIADLVTVHLPWGSLLSGIVHADISALSNIAATAKPGSVLDVLIGYSRKYEAHEMRRRKLPELTLSLIDEHIAPGFLEAGLRITSRSILSNQELKQIPLTWGRRLAHGRERETFRIRAVVETVKPRIIGDSKERVSNQAPVCRFTARGHVNITGKHKTTFEFTRDSVISPKADCIIGVFADWDQREVSKLKEFHKVKMVIACGGASDEVRFVVNPGFENDKEMVIRKSNFRCKRTLGINADKSSIQLNRSLIMAMQNPDSIAHVEVFTL